VVVALVLPRSFALSLGNVEGISRQRKEREKEGEKEEKELVVVEIYWRTCTLTRKDN
jgi:hypothetical protein